VYLVVLVMSGDVSEEKESERRKVLRELRDIIRRYGIEFVADRYLEIRYKGYWFSVSEVLYGCDE